MFAGMWRTLKPGGLLVICDGDFSRVTLASAPNDPLDALARGFMANFVTDAHITGKLRPMAQAAGLAVRDFFVTNRVITSGEGMLGWVEMPAKLLVERGVIGQPLADALVAEYRRRDAQGTLFGFQVFATLIAQRPYG